MWKGNLKIQMENSELTEIFLKFVQIAIRRALLSALLPYKTFSASCYKAIVAFIIKSLLIVFAAKFFARIIFEYPCIDFRF